MSTKATDEPEFESVAAAQLIESSVKLEDTIKPSDEFLQIFKLSYTYFKKPNTFGNKQVRTTETKMKKLYNKVINSKNTSLDDIVTLADSYQFLSRAYMYCHGKKGISVVKNFISHSFSLLKDKELHPKSILVALKLYYYTSHICSWQKTFDKVLETYNKCVELYFTYIEEREEYDIPLDVENTIIGPSKLYNGYEKLDIVYQKILTDAIKFHKSQLPGNAEYLIAYEHLLLVSRLSRLPETKDYYNWIISAITICYRLLKSNCFTEARNHIITALSVEKVFSYETYMRQKVPSLDMLQKYRNVSIYVTVCCIMYGIRLLCSSAERLLRLEGDSASNDLKLGYTTKWKSHILQTLISFDEMKRGNPFPKIFDRSMMVKSILGYDDAHKLFVHTLCQLKKISFDYNPFKNVKLGMDYMLDSSYAYKYMALYEKNTSQTLLQNRHVEILSKALKKKTDSEPYILKRSLLKLAIGYAILIDAKLENFEETDTVYMPQRYHAIMCEIKNLVEKALMNLKMYKEPVESQ